MMASADDQAELWKDSLQFIERMKSLLAEKDAKLAQLSTENAELKAEIERLEQCPKHPERTPGVLLGNLSCGDEAKDPDAEVHISGEDGSLGGRLSFGMHNAWTEELARASTNTDAGILRAMLEEEVDMRENSLRNTHASDRRSTASEMIQQLFRPFTPDSPQRITWECTGILLLWYDVITIPFQAFEPEEASWMQAMAVTALLFWTGDMLMSNMVGFYHEGELIMDRKRITRRYIRHGLAFDLFILLPDWAITLAAAMEVAGDGPFASVVRFLRGARILRLVRLARLVKMSRLMNIIYDLFSSEYMFLWFGILRLGAGISIAAHVVACTWYWVGRSSMLAGQPSWLDLAEISSFGDESLAWRYSTSLHWSMTQFTPASMEIYPKNVAERCMSCIVVFIALITFSSLVSSITTMMTAIRSYDADTKKQFWLVRKYMTQKRVSSSTQTRCIRFLEHHTTERRAMVNVADLRLLGLLSEPLQTLLAFELHNKIICRHPFFSFLKGHLRPVIASVCHSVIKIINMAQDDRVFHAGDVALMMYFVKRGSLKYTPTVKNRSSKCLMLADDWISEPCLWTDWLHRGHLRSTQPSELAVIETATFVEVMRAHQRPWDVCRRYAEQVVGYMNKMDQQKLNDMLEIDNFFDASLLPEGPTAPNSPVMVGTQTLESFSLG